MKKMDASLSLFPLLISPIYKLEFFLILKIQQLY